MKGLEPFTYFTGQEDGLKINATWKIKTPLLKRQTHSTNNENKHNKINTTLPNNTQPKVKPLLTVSTYKTKYTRVMKYLF